MLPYDAPSGWQKISGNGNYRVGDVVIWNGNVGKGWGHVGIVYSTSGSVRIFDQNWVVSNACGIHNISSESNIRGVFRPPFNTVPNDFPGSEDTSYNVPVTVYATHEIGEIYNNDSGYLESGRYISEGDECYVDHVYTSGLCHVKYPSGGTTPNRWAYCKASELPLSKKGNTIVTPTISFDKSTYTVGDTVYVSWTPSPEGSNLENYWLTINGPAGEIVNDDPGEHHTASLQIMQVHIR